MKKTIYIVAMAMVMSGCGWMQKKQLDGVAVELDGQVLTYEQLDEITRTAENSQDSADLAEAYIQQWASEILEYAEARDQADTDLENLVEDYRHSLYVHQYEQRMVSRHHPKQWPDSVVKAIYAQQKEQLILKETIVKGVMLIVPVGTPKIESAQNWLGRLNDANIEKIEKYAYQYATGYEYFPTTWCEANQILLRLPIQTDILTEQLSRQNQIVVKDSTAVYILQITDKRLKGDIMPLDYAQESIEQILLNQWKVGYLKSERQQLYDEAIRFNRLKRYEK